MPRNLPCAIASTLPPSKATPAWVLAQALVAPACTRPECSVLGLHLCRLYARAQPQRQSWSPPHLHCLFCVRYLAPDSSLSGPLCTAAMVVGLSSDSDRLQARPLYPPPGHPRLGSILHRRHHLTPSPKYPLPLAHITAANYGAPSAHLPHPPSLTRASGSPATEEAACSPACSSLPPLVTHPTASYQVSPNHSPGVSCLLSRSYKSHTALWSLLRCRLLSPAHPIPSPGH